MVKVMLVDDEASFATTLGERLQLRSFDVCLANTGKQAISMMAEDKPQVVLLDLSLPDISGLEVMENIKRIDPTTEVIILSGHSTENREEVMAKGAFRYITKPVKLVDLTEVIMSAFEQQREVRGE